MIHEYIIQVGDTDRSLDFAFVGQIRRTCKQLVRCKDCKHHHEAHYEEDGEDQIVKHKCKLMKVYQFSENHYCGFAERKEDD